MASPPASDEAGRGLELTEETLPEPRPAGATYKLTVIVLARLASVFGSFLSVMALNVYLLDLTGSVRWVGLTLAVKVLAGIVATPFIGSAVDRGDRKRLMIASDLVLAGAMAGLAVVPVDYARFYIIFLVVVLGVCGNMFEVALNAAIPEALGSRDTLKANSWFIGGRNLAVAASALCAIGANYLFKGYVVIFLVDAATYLLSAAVLLTIDIRTTADRSAETPKAATGGLFGRIGREFAEVRQLENARVVALFLFVLFLDTFASGSHNIGFPVFSRDLCPDRPLLYYGFIVFWWTLGNLVGIYLLNRMSWLERADPAKLYVTFTALMSVGMILIFQTTWAWAMGCAAFVAGVGDGTYQTYFTTYIQRVPDALRGKVFALSSLALRTGFGLGYVAVPLVLEKVSVANTVLLFHGGALAILVGMVAWPGLLVPRAADGPAEVPKTS